SADLPRSHCIVHTRDDQWMRDNFGHHCDIVGDSPVAAPEPEPQAPQLADRIIVPRVNGRWSCCTMAPCSRVSRLRSVVSRAAQNKKRVMAVRQTASTGSTGDRRRRATLAHFTFHILTKTSATVHRR